MSEQISFSGMNRAELDEVAPTLGVNPVDHSTVPELRAALVAAQQGASAPEPPKVDRYSTADLEAMIARGDALPSGYGFNVSRRPAVYPVGGDPDSGPGPAPTE